MKIRSKIVSGVAIVAVSFGVTLSALPNTGQKAVTNTKQEVVKTVDMNVVAEKPVIVDPEPAQQAEAEPQYVAPVVVKEVPQTQPEPRVLREDELMGAYLQKAQGSQRISQFGTSAGLYLFIVFSWNVDSSNFKDNNIDEVVEMCAQKHEDWVKFSQHHMDVGYRPEPHCAY